MRAASTVIAFAVGISTPLGALAATGEGREAAPSEVEVTDVAASPDGGAELDVAPSDTAESDAAPADEGDAGDVAEPDEGDPAQSADPSESEGPEPGAEPELSERAVADEASTSTSKVPPPTRVEVDPRHYRMVLAGDILIGLGGAGLVAMGVGLGMRSDALAQREGLNYVTDPEPAQIDRQDQRIATGTLVAIAGGAAAGALMVSGITLVALGYRFERQRRASLPAVSLAPTGASLSWSLRF